MIRLDVEPYCHECLGFCPDVEAPEKVDFVGEGGTVEYYLTDTIVRCKYRGRCQAIKRYLEKQQEKSKY